MVSASIFTVLVVLVCLLYVTCYWSLWLHEPAVRSQKKEGIGSGCVDLALH